MYLWDLQQFIIAKIWVHTLGVFVHLYEEEWVKISGFMLEKGWRG